MNNLKGVEQREKERKKERERQGERERKSKRGGKGYFMMQSYDCCYNLQNYSLLCNTDL